MTTDRKGSENPRAAALERSFIETGASPDGLISVYVVFPATRAVLTRFPLRQVAYSALLKVHDGSVWMLRATGQAWTLRRLSAAALTICSATRAGLAREELRRCLAHRLKIPSVSLQDPIFERADPDHWNTRETAEALLARLSRLTNGRFEKPAQPSFEQRLQDALDMAVRDLVEGMNPEVCRSALRGGRINAAIYNYLIPEEHRTYRMQFAATFPILLLPMATALAGTAEADIRLAVDRGIPLTRSLAARWRIRPAVVRFLVGKTPDIVGAQWESNLAGLARLLDALRPEDLPGNHPDARAAFNRAVALAERIFRRRSWASPAALAWLREVARRGWICHDGDPEAEALGPESIAAIHQFRDGLFQTLLAGTCGSSAGRDSGASADVEEAADRVLAQMRPRRLAQVAKRFELELARAKADLSTDIGVLRGASFWPLIPAAYVSADGSRRIVALTSRKALCVQGTALKICLAYERLDWYARQCRRAASFVLGVLDATSGAPCSTVHIRPSHHLPGAAWHLELLEHTSLRNSPPSAACKRAVRELLRCENVSIQAHLDRGYRLICEREARGVAWARRHAELLPVTKALRTTLGDRLYENLWRKVWPGRALGIDASETIRTPMTSNAAASPEAVKRRQKECCRQRPDRFKRSACGLRRGIPTIAELFRNACTGRWSFHPEYFTKRLESPENPQPMRRSYAAYSLRGPATRVHAGPD